MSALTKANPMRSTWRTADRGSWTFSHWFLGTFQIHPTTLGEPVPKYSKGDRVPYLSQFTAQRWILFHACILLVLEALVVRYMGRNIQAIELFSIYIIPFSLTLLRQIHVLLQLGHEHGFFDGDEYPRDQIPDIAVHKITFTLVKMAIFRLGIPLYITYQKNTSPKLNLPWLPLYIGVYPLLIDFAYYWIHRATHELDFLWPTHSLHHHTKHPTAPLTAYADQSENLTTMTGVPMLSYVVLRTLGLDLSFHDWWICSAYVTFSEMMQHSGVRVHVSAASTIAWLLQYMDVDLVVEDHDLHHRRGWKKSFNYGKQSRIWDRVFGTARPRVEGVRGIVDYDRRAGMPVF